MSNRLWLFVFLAFCCGVRAQCPDTSQYIRWSANPLWNTVNATVNITAGQKVLLDVAPSVVLGVIQVRGTLFVSNKQMELQTQGIVVYSGGSLIVGTPSCPITAKVTITLFGRKANAGADTLGTDPTAVPILGNVVFGSKGIAVAQNGSLQMNGYVNPLGPLWCRLSKTAMQGDTTLTLDTPVYWNAGDSIVISSTDFSEVLDSKLPNTSPMNGVPFPEQSETAVISSISADKKTLTLKTPLSWMHWGINYERAEVGLLTRNIVVRGDNTSESELYGGHVLLRHGQILQITGVEFTRMGQQGILGRYPVHFHMAMDVYDITAALINSSLHNNYQRCISIHGTSGVLVKQNVAYKTYGHCYFLEDGSETNNTFDGNLGVYAKLMYPPLIPSDVQPSMFWITHPQNIFKNNAASSTHVGYWIIPPNTPLGLSAKVWPDMQPGRASFIQPFADNVAHSCYKDGLQVEDGQDSAGNLVQGKSSWSLGPSKADNVFSRFLAYKCRRSAFWALFIPFSAYYDMVMLDSGNQLFIGTDMNALINVTFVGESDNYGLAVGNRSRSIPSPDGIAYYVGGYRNYDNGGGAKLINCTFINFTSSADKMMGGFVNSNTGQFGTFPDGACYNCKFINSNPMVSGTDVSLHLYNTVKNGLCYADGSGVIIPGGGWMAGNQTFYTTIPGVIPRPETNGYLIPSFHGRMVAMHMPPNPYGQSSPNPRISTDTQIYKESTGPSTVVLYRPLGSAPDSPYLFSEIDLILTFDSDCDSAVGKAPTPSLGYWSPLFTDSTGRRTAALPYLDLSIPDAKRGDWNVVAIPVPRGVQYNVTHVGVLLRQSSRWEDLSPSTTWYNNTNQHLYVLVNEDFWNFWLFPYRNVSSGGYDHWQVTMSFYQIRSDCTLDQCSLPGAYVVPPMPSTIPYVLRYDKYRAKFKTPAGQAAAESQVYLQLYPSSVLEGPAAGFQIWHNVPLGSADIYASWEDRSTGLTLADNVIGQTAFTSMIRLSRAFWQAAVDGNLQMSIRSIADGRQLLVGVFQLENPTAAFVPPPSPSACAKPSYEIMSVYNGSFASSNYTAPTNIQVDGAGTCGGKPLILSHNTNLYLRNDRQAITVPSRFVSLEFYVRATRSFNNYNYFNLSVEGTTPSGKNLTNIVASKSTDFIINSHGWSFVRVQLADMGGNTISALRLSFYHYSTDTPLLVDQLRFSTAAPISPISMDRKTLALSSSSVSSSSSSSSLQNADRVLANGGEVIGVCVTVFVVSLFALLF
ncbi:hypothetical protein PROFUN_03508 [Planoprotostelium fungivorum]|uniref:G8 domain-containing protein n=1 Tax=Planoprotostelium fungivorum TaxID=1890364 RepID=A0A2P6MNA0_9EUKA|nr:hypothetical protein PROFUN_03508 [Planoprotostelium fungivorum]